MNNKKQIYYIRRQVQYHIRNKVWRCIGHKVYSIIRDKVIRQIWDHVPELWGQVEDTYNQQSFKKVKDIVDEIIEIYSYEE